MPCRRDKNLLGLMIIDLVNTLCSKNFKATILDIWVNLQEGSNVVKFHDFWRHTE